VSASLPLAVKGVHPSEAQPRAAQCALPECHAPIPEQRLRWAARTRAVCRTCCEEHQRKLRELEAPRQKRLPLEPPTEPALVLNPTAPAERKLSLQRKCWACLDRLELGPAHASELERIGGRRFGARLNELEGYLRAVCGFDPRDGTKDAILCVKPNCANPVYMLAAWAEPGNRPHRSEDGAETGGEG